MSWKQPSPLWWFIVWAGLFSTPLSPYTPLHPPPIPPIQHTVKHKIECFWNVVIVTVETNRQWRQQDAGWGGASPLVFFPLLSSPFLSPIPSHPFTYPSLTSPPREAKPHINNYQNKPLTDNVIMLIVWLLYSPHFLLHFCIFHFTKRVAVLWSSFW